MTNPITCDQVHQALVDSIELSVSQHPRILVLSFSGGRTSAFMVKWCLDNLRSHYDVIIVLFANTGQEDEATLCFVRDCDLYFGFRTVWLESVVHEDRGAGTTHKIVSFETATRGHDLFEKMIAKYGIPNKAYPHCTRELKLQPIESYLKSLGIKKSDRCMAIGIRSDEQRRVRKDATDENIIYPLVDLVPTTKQEILDWWEDQKFNLHLRGERYGNCLWCWKKSPNKHMHLINEAPQIFSVPNYFEKKYAFAGNGSDKERPRKFFRGDMSTEDLFRQFRELKGCLPTIKDSDTDDGCSASCELFPTTIEPSKTPNT